MQLEIMAVPVLYALFMVIVSTLATLLFRANLTVERKIPDGLL
jgi:bile acid:Na+ symporter, BASS family